MSIVEAMIVRSVMKMVIARSILIVNQIVVETGESILALRPKLILAFVFRRQWLTDY
jgi:hypothetical protein